MRNFHILCAVLALHGGWCLAAESSYYQDLQRACAGKRLPVRVTSPSLVDTNNVSPTTRRKPVLLEVGSTAGVRLGMSMEEVVSLWGKPPGAGLSCNGRPCFSYDDLWVEFQDDQVYAVGLSVRMPFTPQFTGGLLPLSRQAEWIRLLGEPARQDTNDWSICLCYKTNQTVMTLRFDLRDKQLSAVSLGRPQKAEASGKANELR